MWLLCSHPTTPDRSSANFLIGSAMFDDENPQESSMGRDALAIVWAIVDVAILMLAVYLAVTR